MRFHRDAQWLPLLDSPRKVSRNTAQPLIHRSLRENLQRPQKRNADVHERCELPAIGRHLPHLGSQNPAPAFSRNRWRAKATARSACARPFALVLLANLADYLVLQRCPALRAFVLRLFFFSHERSSLLRDKSCAKKPER